MSDIEPANRAFAAALVATKLQFELWTDNQHDEIITTIGSIRASTRLSVVETVRLIFVGFDYFAADHRVNSSGSDFVAPFIEAQAMLKAELEQQHGSARGIVDSVPYLKKVPSGFGEWPPVAKRLLQACRECEEFRMSVDRRFRDAGLLAGLDATPETLHLAYLALLKVGKYTRNELLGDVKIK